MRSSMVSTASTSSTSSGAWTSAKSHSRSSASTSRLVSVGVMALGDLEETAQEPVHAAPLDLGARLPSGQGRLRDPEMAREFPLPESERLAERADFGRLQE